jgi:hypothetical protein
VAEILLIFAKYSIIFLKKGGDNGGRKTYKPSGVFGKTEKMAENIYCLTAPNAA